LDAPPTTFVIDPGLINPNAPPPVSTPPPIDNLPPIVIIPPIAPPCLF
jgi:hypothetical protein